MRLEPDKIVLEGPLRRCRKTRVLGVKWSHRWVVLYRRNPQINAFSLLEYKTNRKARLLKSLDLEQCTKVDSHLSLRDPSVGCSAAGKRDLEWIFSVTLNASDEEKEVFLVADTEETMNHWVEQLCKACHLQRFTKPASEFAKPIESMAGVLGEMSVSNNSFDSLDHVTGESQRDVQDPWNRGVCGSSNIYEQRDYGRPSENESEDITCGFNFGGIEDCKRNLIAMETRRLLLARQQQEEAFERERFLAESAAQREAAQMRFAICEETLKDLVGICFSPEQPRPQNLQASDCAHMIEDGKGYMQLENMSNASVSRSSTRDRNYAAVKRSESYGVQETSSVSGCSSLGSSRMTTEEDSASCVSGQFGPPVPPRGRPTRTSHDLFATKKPEASSLNQTATTSSQTIDEHDTSGETIKIIRDVHVPSYTESVASSESGRYDRQLEMIARWKNEEIPPPVDRSKKPANLRTEDDGRVNRKWSYSLNRQQSNENNPRRFTPFTTSRANSAEISGKRRNLDYFEPQHMRISAVSSTRSPTPPDIDYITVDMDRTWALKAGRKSHS